MSDNAIIVDSLSKVYGNNFAVKDLNFSVKLGEVHGFLGPNGAGKSTTMKMIAGLLKPSEGSTWVLGHNVQSNPDKIKQDIGILLENPPLYKDMIVRDYLKFVSKLHKVDKSKVNSFVDDAISKLHIEEVADRLIGNLSKGFKQRVGVAQAIVHNPKIVILDEPTVGLDPEAVIKMRELIKNLASSHTVLLSSHLLHEISLICDRVTIIAKGQLQASGPIHEIESSLSAKRVIEVQVMQLSEKLISTLSSLEFIQKVESSGNLIKLYTDNVHDYRSEVSKMIVQMDAGLLMLKQNELTLEEIFISVTKGSQK